jgi:hypothetical protein
MNGGKAKSCYSTSIVVVDALLKTKKGFFPPEKNPFSARNVLVPKKREIQEIDIYSHI